MRASFLHDESEQTESFFWRNREIDWFSNAGNLASGTVEVDEKEATLFLGVWVGDNLEGENRED